MLAKTKPQTVRSLNRLLKSHDYQEILDLGRPLVGNPLILTSVTYAVLAITDEPDITSPNWQEIRDSRGIPIGSLGFEKLNNAYRKSLEEQYPVFDSSLDDGVQMLRKTLCVGEKVLGYLDSPLYFKEPTEEDVELFDLLGNLLAVELQRGLERATIPDNMQDYFIFDLLEGRLTDPALIEERFRFFKWNIMGRGMVQVVSIRRSDGDLERNNLRFRELVEQLTNIFPVFKTFAYGAQLKMLCPVTEALSQEAHAIQDLNDFLEQQDMVAGISRPLNEVQFISDFNRQAEKAAELGSVFHPGKRIYFYDDYAVYHALELSTQKEDALQFCHSAIMRLLDYDREHDTNLLESLRVYLTHNRSIGESAGLLYIHRNTMNYRIAKIHELTDIDLDNPEVFSHLLFSFFALDFRQHQSKLSSGREYPKGVHPPLSAADGKETK